MVFNLTYTYRAISPHTYVTESIWPRFIDIGENVLMEGVSHEPATTLATKPAEHATTVQSIAMANALPTTILE